MTKVPSQDCFSSGMHDTASKPAHNFLPGCVASRDNPFHVLASAPIPHNPAPTYSHSPLTARSPLVPAVTFWRFRDSAIPQSRRSCRPLQSSASRDISRVLSLMFEYTFPRSPASAGAHSPEANPICAAAVCLSRSSNEGGVSRFDSSQSRMVQSRTECPSLHVNRPPDPSTPQPCTAINL